jgi:anti-anti-sigma regulatory factor
MTMSELTITVSQIQGDVAVTVLHLEGHLHGATEQDLVDQARQAREDGATHLLLDLSKLEILSSAGLRGIQSVFKLYTPPTDTHTIRQHADEPYKSPYMKMASPDPQIYYILNITGFLQNILIYNDLDEAIRSFGS